MAGRIYNTETEYFERVRKDNETWKALSGLFMNGGLVLFGGAVVQVYAKGWADDPNVVWWFLISVLLILIGVAFTRLLKSES